MIADKQTASRQTSDRHLSSPLSLPLSYHALVTSLLTWDANARLGARGVQQMRAGEVHEVLGHAFFAGIDWEALEEKRGARPFELISMDQAVRRSLQILSPSLHGTAEHPSDPLTDQV